MASLGLSKQPWSVQLGAFVLIAALGAGLFYYLYDMPKQEELAARDKELQTVLEKNRQGAETARQLPAFRSQIAELEARLDALKPILPEEKDVGDLLRRIQTLATQSNLTIRGFRPQPIAERELHAEWPIGLELEGSYHNLGTFLDRVSRFPRIINVGNMIITPHNEGSAGATLRVSCTATTFVLVEQQPPAKPAAATNTAAAKAAPAEKTE